MPVHLECISHTPLHGYFDPPDEVVSEVKRVQAQARERVRAFVVWKDGASGTEQELRAHCKAQLAGPKVPRDFVFLPELPRNPTGKVLKRDLRLHQG